MKTLQIAAAAALAVALTAGLALAERLPHHAVCDKICVPTTQPGKEAKSCWKVEYEEICVPGFRLPWSKCCEPVCGHVIRVKVLKRETYECDKCDTQWNIEHAPCAVGCCPTVGHHGDCHGHGGQVHGGQVHGGQAYGGQAYGGQAYGGQIHGGQAYGGQIQTGQAYGDPSAARQYSAPMPPVSFQQIR